MVRSAVLFILMVMSLTAAASEPEAKPYFVDAWLEPTKAVPGQHMTLNILIGVDTYFARAAQLSIPEIDHALVLLNDRAINGSENRNGESFASQLWEVNVYPNREGILVVPSFAVGFTRALTDGNKLSQQRVEVRVEQLLGLVSLPPAMKGLSGFMVSTDVEVDDEWTFPEDKELFTRGDIFQRVITVSATDMTAMNMPQFNPQVPKGISVTLAEPSLASSNGRDGPKASMVQRITYVIEKPGQFSLGGESISWWNPQESSREDYQFDSKTIDAGGIPWRLVWTVLALILLIVFSYLGFRRYLLMRDPRDVAIKKDLHHNDASKRMAAIYAYADHHNPEGNEPVRLKRLLLASSTAIERILQSRFSSSTDDTSPTARESKQLYRKIKQLSGD
jgi:hypothetical protein